MKWRERPFGLSLFFWFTVLAMFMLSSSDTGLAEFCFDALSRAENLSHGIFHRHGGVSPSPWGSLNVGLAVGDAPERVAENRQRIKQALGLSSLVGARQVHGDRVAVVKRDPGGDIDEVDALVSDEPGIGLMIQQADCQAVLLYDPARPAVGIAHSGWRGSVANIIANTVVMMGETFGSEPGGMYAAVSPSLGPCCGEFVNHQQELPDSFRSFLGQENHFDFWAISRFQLQETGIRPERISVAGLCTVCDPRFFSYRRAKITGRNASVIGLRI